MKEAQVKNWKPATWLLIGSLASVFGSATTASLLVASKMMKIHYEGLF